MFITVAAEVIDATEVTTAHATTTVETDTWPRTRRQSMAKRRKETDSSEVEKKKEDEEKGERVDEKDVDETADRTEEQMGQLIVHRDKGIKIDPLAVKVPIIDWYFVMSNNLTTYKLVRADKSETRFPNPSKIIKSVTREYLEDLYKVGVRKYGIEKEGSSTQMIFSWSTCI